jgi:hypothetical protein
MGTNRSGKRRTQRQKRSKREAKRLASKPPAASIPTAPAKPAQS